MDFRERRRIARAARDLADGLPLDETPEESSATAEARGHLGRLRDLAHLAEAFRPPPRETDEQPAPLGTWGPLLLLEKIGEGGFGEVYRAFDPALRREVALKLQKPAAHLPSEHYGRRVLAAARAAARQLLPFDEARRLARVRHPHVLAIHGVESHDGRAGLWTDLVRGRTLEDVVRVDGPLRTEEARRIGIELARALRAVHDVDLVHGDIKTTNVMIENDGRAILMDFGAALGLREGRDRALRFGTPAILAPELLDGQPLAPGSDIFALGVLLYRALTGRYPHSGTTAEECVAAALARARTPIGELRPDLPPVLIEVVERALAPDPALRYRSAGEVEIALAATLEEPLTVDARSENRDRLHGVPDFAHRFIGRGRELARIRERVGRTRLLTLTGPGGTGKTRLAAEATAELALAFPDGAWWIDLAALESAALVAESTARGCGAPVDLSLGVEASIVRHLADRSVLLVFDNCEHLLGPTAALASRLLQGAPRLFVLATSRAPLGLAEEEVLPVPPLALSRDGQSPAESEAARLFLDRARLRGPAVRLDGDDLAAVERACRRLEGLPLAIEMAAACVPALGAETLADRLDQNLFSIDRSASPGRQGTLRALVEWSHRLLEPEERVLFRRLSVLRGGWLMETAEAIAADPPSDEPVGPATGGPEWTSGPRGGVVGGRPLVDVAMSLVEKSLLSFDPTTSRYRLLEVVRAYALERLRESGEEEPMRRRKLAHYRELTRDLPRHLQGPRQDDWTRRIDAEHDDLRDALEWAQRDPATVETGAALAVSLRRFWYAREFAHEGLRHYEAFAALPGVTPATRAWLLQAASSLAYRKGDLTAAESFGARALAMFRDGGDRNGEAATLTALGTYRTEQGDYRGADARLLDALEIRRALGPSLALAAVLTNLGVNAGRQGDLARARALYEEALELFRREGDELHAAHVLDNLCATAKESGDLRRAEELGLECVRLFRAIGDRRALAHALEKMGDVAREQGRLDQALEHHMESLHIRTSLHVVDLILRSIEAIGELALTAGMAEEAAVLLAAAEAQREATAFRPSASVLERRRSRWSEAEKALGDRVLRRARAEGRALTLAAVLERTLGLSLPG